MKISMYSASVPVFKRMLGNVDVILDKAAAWATERKIDPNALLLARLAPDMFTLTRQVQIATDMAKGTCGRLAGVELPRYEDVENSFATLKARIAKCIAFLDGLRPEQFEGAEERDIKLPIGGQTMEFKGHDYLLGFGTPNVYFHVTMVYAILRHNGLPIGKQDYIGMPR
jgi:uncharacterized protein